MYLVEFYEEGGKVVKSDEVMFNVDCICREDFVVDYNSDETVAEIMIKGIKDSGVSIAEFSRKSGISESSIVRYKQSKTEPSLESVVAYCISQQLNVFEALYLTSKAGYNIFCSEDRKVYLVLFMLSRYNKISVSDANEILIQLGVKPLNNLYNHYENGE